MEPDWKYGGRNGERYFLREGGKFVGAEKEGNAREEVGGKKKIIPVLSGKKEA